MGRLAGKGEGVVRAWVVELALLLAGVVVVAVFASKFWFRIEVVDNPTLGEMKYKYRWGGRAWLEVDRNRDGLPDAKARLLPGSPATPKELWEDRDSDGVFEIHARMNRRGEIIFLEIDEDNNGVEEVLLHGDEAAAYWEERFAGGKGEMLGVNP
jgi:hypothetical protein